MDLDFLETTWPMIAGFILAWYIVVIIAWFQIFHKFGEPRWKAIIPIYNYYIQYKRAWSGIWFWIMLILNVAAYILWCMCGEDKTMGIISGIMMLLAILLDIECLFKLSRCFGHGFGWGLGLVFFNPIFIMMLGFGKSEYKKVL